MKKNLTNILWICEQRLSIVAGIANDDGDSGEEDVSKEF